ncbi:MAG: hypothetical protein JF922_13400 [Candidatus Dormibacteraeota bacterium]|uniref:Uncharacterized protein n=1 Tax=Candidatus Nephthysia bennettiae TaxID=3127016 RepID=A0A934NE26_9BACT|nr:hypothetical protein [Candidatus Dormibacteraeota bacterium]MBJ7612708.1 hypothetical protein [Candidatus Dormibacteraeota bacterium]
MEYSDEGAARPGRPSHQGCREVSHDLAFFESARGLTPARALGTLARASI